MLWVLVLCGRIQGRERISNPLVGGSSPSGTTSLPPPIWDSVSRARYRWLVFSGLQLHLFLPQESDRNAVTIRYVKSDIIAAWVVAAFIQ